MRCIITILSVLAIAGALPATVINVPGDYPTIQAGINAASSGDTVLVAPGTYYENIQMAEGITLLGSGWQNTTIDGGGLANVITAYQVSNVTIEGFTVQNAEQSGSAPGCIGIHLNPQSSSGTKIVRNCRVRNNGHGIEIWNDFGGVAYIENNIIYDNIYDGFSPYLGTVYLTNNTIVDNGRDGYNDWSGGGYIQIQNNIIAHNGRYGIYKHLNTPVYISYNDVWENVEGAYYQGYSGPPEPFVPNPGTGEIAEDPLFFGQPFDYYITWANFPTPDSTMSPCIDAGNPASPPDPDGTTADIGALYFDQTEADVEVSLPVVGPIVIPASGGSFDFNVALTNNEATSQSFDAWIMVTLPSGTPYGPVLGPVNLTLPGGGSIDRDRTQNVPAGAPPGTYDYVAYVGIFPTTIWDSDSFPFEKLGSEGSDGLTGWFNSGESFGDEGNSRIAPTTCGLSQIYPNPFNPTTVISYKLQDASFTNLTVYDISGRLVADLANGWREAGYHEVTFDGSGLASGVYIVRLSAGDFSQTQKVILLK